MEMYLVAIFWDFQLISIALSKHKKILLQDSELLKGYKTSTVDFTEHDQYSVMKKCYRLLENQCSGAPVQVQYTNG